MDYKVFVPSTSLIQVGTFLAPIDFEEGKPVTDSHIPASKSTQLKRKAPQKPPQKPKQTKKILIAEHSPDLATITKAFLEREGYHCIMTANGRQAVALAGTVVPDLIITAIQLAEMDGLEAARLIRQNPNTSSIPILVVSAKDPYEEWQNNPRLFDEYIAKPFTSEKLISSVERLIT